MDVVYTTQRSGFSAGRRYRNPRYFGGPMTPGVSRVIVVGDWPHIVRAYKGAGVEVVVVDGSTPTGGANTLIDAIKSGTAGKTADAAIPDDWRDLPWTKAADGGTTLRSLASSVSDVPVVNRAQAIAAIEAEIARRGAL